MIAPLLALAVAAGAAAPAPPPPASHPLDPLSLREIAATVEVIRAAKIVRPEALFPMIALQEPSKQEVLAYEPGKPFARRAFAVLLDRERNETSEAVVDLGKREIESWRVIPGVQPLFLVEELTSAPEIVRADARWQEAMRRRGVSDLEKVHLEGWAPGTLGVTNAEGPRLVRVLSYYKGASRNHYSRPIEGVVALVDMSARKVIELVDTGVVPVSSEPASYDQASQPSLRSQPKPLQLVQPQGPEFSVNGSEVRWQKWRLRFSMHPREGLVLHTVGYEDRGRVRPVLYRASLSEMFVPYGDTDKNWAWRSAFDEGEYGVGRLAAPLEPGVDVPENARLFDAAFADDFGKPYTLPRAVAVYERDGGLLWKHYTIDENFNESRRGRELVLTTIATVGNYDYAYSWVFKQDGSIENELALTGIMLAKGVEPSSSTHAAHFAHLVSSTVAAPHHQHFFNFRLDFDVDGSTNTVYEAETKALPSGADNPAGNGMTVVETPLRSAKSARRDLNMAAARRWIVRSPDSRNALGQETGFALVPGDNTVPFLRPENAGRRRASFINHHVWVTPFDAEQLHAAGDYPNQATARDGLERWSDADESVEARDVVVWYTLGVTHIPRPEEWPVMPATRLGFKLLPVSFFDRNPALDLPRPAAPPAKRKQ